MDTRFKKGQIPWNKKEHIIKVCFKCGKQFNVKPCLARIVCCSQRCARLGEKASKETKLKQSESLKGKLTHKIISKGENHYLWKGDNVGYEALHHWIKRNMKKPAECVYCGEDQKRIEWASISHHAKRDLTDYIPLCVTCHREYDKKERV
jgi:hypothetical protein